MLSRPKLGVATWTLGQRPFGQQSFADVASIVAELNYDGVVIPVGQPPETAATIRQLLQDNELALFGVTPHNVDLAHPETAVRQQALDHYEALLDFAAALGRPPVLIHGRLGRSQPISSWAEERDLLQTAVSHLAAQAKKRNLMLALSVVNRYESHLLNTAVDALAFIDEIGADNVGLALSVFHMNIEEQDAGGVIRGAGDKLRLFFMADSNRQAIGRGHLKLGLHLWALEEAPDVPVIMECVPPGMMPFSYHLDEETLALAQTYLAESRSWF